MTNETERELERIRKALERIATALEPQELKQDPELTFGDRKRLVETGEEMTKLAEELNEGMLSLETNPALLGKLVGKDKS